MQFCNKVRYRIAVCICRIWFFLPLYIIKIFFFNRCFQSLGLQIIIQNKMLFCLKFNCFPSSCSSSSLQLSLSLLHVISYSTEMTKPLHRCHLHTFLNKLSTHPPIHQHYPAASPCTHTQPWTMCINREIREPPLAKMSN